METVIIKYKLLYMSVIIKYKSTKSNSGDLTLLCEEVGAVPSVCLSVCARVCVCVCVCVCVFEDLVMSVTHSQLIQHLFRKNIQWGIKVWKPEQIIIKKH